MSNSRHGQKCTLDQNRALHWLIKQTTPEKVDVHWRRGRRRLLAIPLIRFDLVHPIYLQPPALRTRCALKELFFSFSDPPFLFLRLLFWRVSLCVLPLTLYFLFHSLCVSRKFHIYNYYFQGTAIIRLALIRESFQCNYTSWLHII